MRVLLFYFAELGSLGGVEVVVRNLAEKFTARGFPAGIAEIAPAWKQKRFLSNGIPVWGVTAPSYTTICRPRSWVSFVRTSFQFQKVVNAFNADVVHVHYPLIQSLPVIGAHWIPHAWRLVVTVHNSDVRQAPLEEPRIRPWQARLFDRADAVTAVSQSLLADTTALYPCVKEKGRVIHNGICSTWFESDEPARVSQEKYVVFVGRLHPMKGVDLLLHAWKQIGARFSGTELWLVGDGPERENLEALAKELGISSQVRFVGPMSQQDLPRLYQGAEAVVLPSRREGLPLSLLEAGACGGLCIATSIPGITEVIEDGVTGFLSEPESPDALTAAICRALQAPPETSRRMREGLQSTIRQRFSEETVVTSYLELFQDLLGKQPSKKGTDTKPA
jgi:glycosyltransferase involved in cell wall biosynthesis